MTCMLGIDLLKKLCEKYGIQDYETIYRQFNHFRTMVIDKHTFVNESIVMAYECAFFLHYTGLKINKKKFCTNFSVKIFNAAYKEVREKFKPLNIKRRDKIVCNLYSIIDENR